jgi:hypothetical protein
MANLPGGVHASIRAAGDGQAQPVNRSAEDPGDLLSEDPATVRRPGCAAQPAKSVPS